MDIKNEELYNLIKEFQDQIGEINKFGMNDSAGFRNLMAIKDYTVKTREMFRELQKENKLYKNQVMEQGKVIEQLKDQMTKLQIKVYQNNATS